MSLGKILYKVYYQPKGTITKTLKQGIYNTWQMNRGKKEMEKAASRIEQIIYPNKSKGNLLEFSFLTGKKFWYMTAFCAYSLSKVVPHNIRFVFYDDGSFDEKLENQIAQQFHFSRIVSKKDIEERLRKALPESKFPFLHYKRKVYPHIKKLTDVHVGARGYQLLLDSDMLFWEKPNIMLNWLNNSINPFYILDVENSYYYSFKLMQELTGEQIPNQVNVGAIGIKSEEIDWEKLEYWAKTMEEQEGSSYLLEQALSAMLLAGKNCTVAPEKEYIVMPSKDITLHKKGVLHHYVAESKEWYYQEAWKELI